MYKIKKESMIYFLLWIVISSISSWISVKNPLITMNENQILYLFSASSQVIAAVFGLVITGYIFLRNELDRKVIDDDSYEEIISFLKKDYYISIINISSIAVISILLCFITISLLSQNSIFINILMNLASTTIVLELLLIVLFVMKILNPNSFEIASDTIKMDLSSQDKTSKGSLEDFLRYYNELEEIITKYGSEFYKYSSQEFNVYKRRSISKTKLVNILLKEEKISISLKEQLINLISFRNSLIHGTDLSISEEDVLKAKEILLSLKGSLHVS